MPFEQIRAQGYEGGCTRLTDLIRDLCRQEGAAVVSGIVPFEKVLRWRCRPNQPRDATPLD